MKIFLSEYLTSGALPGEGSVKASLAAEGAAMLRALAADAAAVPGWTVAVTWDRTLPPFGVPGVDVFLVAGRDEERRAFGSHVHVADATLVIAPEFEGLLEGRRRLVEECGGCFVGPTAEAIALCGDKLALARHLRERGIPTIQTRRCSFTARGEMAWPPVGIVKPRHGAGSMNTFRVMDAADLKVAEAAFQADSAVGEPILQPFISGTPLSIAAIIGAGGTELLPICRQQIGGSKRLHYEGGSVPAATDRDDEIADLARRALAVVPGLYGYVGLDIILPEDASSPVVVEINPRLTSSYHGYRRLAMENLAERVLSPDRPRPPIEWRTERIEYSPDGVVLPSTKEPA